VKQKFSFTTRIERCSCFYLCAALFVGSLCLLVLNFSKAESFMLLNQYHSSTLDIFFDLYTFLGDGIFTLLIAVVCLFLKQKKLAIIIIVAYLSSGLLVQLLKNIVHAPRPRVYFADAQYGYLLKHFQTSGVGFSGFPSGHTTSAFALATVLALWFTKQRLGIFLAVAAALVGYSRIYTAQHFPIDVLAGACVGLFFGSFVVFIFRHKAKWSLPKNEQSPLLN
jgi:membrane-associated phospholipid phosphatase